MWESQQVVWEGPEKFIASSAGRKYTQSRSESGKEMKFATNETRRGENMSQHGHEQVIGHNW